MMLLAAPVVAGTYFSGDASSRGASEGDISNVTTDRNPLPGAVVAAGGISGGAVSSHSDNEVSSAPSTASPTPAAVAGAPFGDDASSTSDSSSASEGDSLSTNADSNPFSGAVMTATGIVGDLPSTGSDSEGSSMPSMTSPRTSVSDDASSSGDSSSALEGNPSNANADPNPLPRAVVAVTGTIGDSPSTDSDSDDMDSRGSDSEFVSAPYPYHDSFSDFNSRQVAAGSSTRVFTHLSKRFERIPRLAGSLPVEDSISDFSTRQNLHTSSEIMCAPMPATDSFSDLQTRQPTSALSRASVQLSMIEDPFEKSGEGPNTSFVAMAGTKVQDASHQPESSLLRFQQRRSQRLSAFSSSMRANSVARRKSTADPTLTRSYDRNDLRSSMPPPTLSGLFDVRLRSLHEHTDQDDKSDSSYFDSVVGGADDVDTTDKGKTVAFQDALEVAAFESALGRFSMEADAVIADDAVAAGPNKFVGGHSTDKVNTVDRLQPMPLSDQRMAEKDIWGSIADAGAPEHDRPDEVLVWALSRSMSRLAAADRMGELSLPPGIVQVSSSSSDGGEPNDNDLSSLGTPISSSSSSLSSEVER
ncbi:hypothetical protein MHU86_9228 [Fragilaria crotonensis]|nr:hypothetical protein MHU86_9228 [Fragilaria crotonensis]